MLCGTGCWLRGCSGCENPLSCILIVVLGSVCVCVYISVKRFFKTLILVLGLLVTDFSTLLSVKFVVFISCLTMEIHLTLLN